MDSDIAIVGMAGRFPGARSLKELWRNLRDGVESISFLSDEELLAAGVDPERLQDPSYVKAAPILDNVDQFDAPFFGLSPREAELLDPQHRFLMECAWEAIEEAGYDPRSYPGAIGIFAGMSLPSYLLHIVSRTKWEPTLSLDALHVLLGNDKDYLATRIAYKLNLKGPSVSVQTACSTSLVAVHLACQSLLSGESDMALAGGVTVRVPHKTGYWYQEGGIASPDGHCRSFDASSRGTLFGSGAGIVLLKRLERALADGDPVRAVIKGSAINNDGARKVGYSSPGIDGQSSVIAEAMAIAGVDPGTVSYVECHGSGTPVGDPIEIRAMTEAFAGAEGRARCGVGSVKTNLGHLESAAGIAGLIKTVLALENEQIPPSLHFRQPNPEIELEKSPFYVVDRLEPWGRSKAPRRAGVNSFGIGGTNAHVVLEEAPPRVAEASHAPLASAVVVPLSAKSLPALMALAQAYEGYIAEETSVSLYDVAYTASVRRSHHEHRLAVVGRSREELCEALRAYGRGDRPAGVASGEAMSGARARVAFVFSGQGSQWVGMGRQLLEQEPVFRSVLARCDALIKRYAGWSLLVELAAPEETSRLSRTVIAQPALFAMQVGLCEVLKAWGITPDAVVGHSVGEIAAAHIAGALSLEEAVRLVCSRGQVMEQATGLGKMASVALSANEAAQALRGYEDRLSIAAINDPGSVVLSGDAGALSEVVERLQQQGVHVRMLRVDYAFHSPQMAPFQAELKSALGRIELRRVERPMYSTVTGAKIEGDALEPGYWARNMREPVQLAGALESAIRDGYRLFVEVGPHPVLTANVQECLRASAEPGHALPTLRRGQEERPCLLQALGGLYAHGYGVDWRRQYPERGRVVSLPAYPWQRQRYWIDHKAGMRVAEGAVSSGHPLLGMHVPAAGAGAVFETELSVEAAPYLSDHRVFDEVVVPGAALLELAHAGAAAHLGTERIHVTGLVVQAPLVLPEHERVRVQVVLEEGSAASTPVRVYSQAASAKAGEPWTVHAQGYVQSTADEAEPARVDVADMLARCRTSVSAVERYAAFAEAGLTYGPAFQGMTELWQGKGEAVVRLSLPVAAGDPADGYGMHPALLDAAWQVLGVALSDGTLDEVYLPFEVTSYRLWKGGVREAWVHARRVEGEGEGAGTEVVSGDITVVDSEGRVLAEVKGLRLKRATASALRRGKEATGSEWLIGLSWKEAILSTVVEERSEPGVWLVLTDGSALGRGLVERLRRQGARCVTAARGAETVQFDEQSWVVDPWSPQALGQVVAGAEAGQLSLRGVVCLWAAEPLLDCSPVERAEALAVAGLHVVQSLARRAGASPARLWWVTRGAQAVTAGEPVDVVQAPLWGLGRVVMQEHPEMGSTLVDLDAGPGAEDSAEALWQEVWRSDNNEETQVAWRQGKRYGARLVRAGAALEPREPLRLEPASTALITGGLGALGLHVARWLVEQHKVRHVVLVGRSAAEGARLAAVEELRSAGAEVTVAQVDIADRAQVQALLAAIPPELPLRAIVHAAGVLDDGVLTHQDAARFAAVLAPKVHGAWNLHTLTRDLTLDIFVLFSSAASLLGSAGQGNYAAGNAFLDALAQQRFAEGSRAHSIAWGPWSEGGMAAKLDKVQQGRILRQGFGTISPATGLSVLEQVLARPEAQLGVLPLDLRALGQTFSTGPVPPLWRALVKARPERAPGAPGASLSGWSARLGALSPMERAREVEAAVRAELGRVLSLSSASEVPEGRPLQELGLDSLMAVELRNGLAGRVGKPLPATLVFDYPTVSALTRYLLDKVLAVEVAPLVVRPSRSRAADNEPIAIVGIGCRYPGGVYDVDSFWSLLEQGVDAIREVPRERWDVNAYYNADPDVPGTMITRSGGFLDEVEQFDPAFFGISPREAVKMDPQQRLLLETSWEALEHAGLVPERLMDSDTGVFVGMMYHDYASLGDGALDQLDGYVGTGNAGSIASGRISYLLGLKGPSLTVDTACSSSLVTLHLACQSLRSGECSVALAGGVALMLTPASHVEFSRLRGLSPDGRCKSFDASADGVAWSEGCGMVVLKRLSDAQRDGDPVLGLIRGSAVNQDGRSNGLTAPNGPSQEAVIRRALEQAGIAPAAVGYVEAHGTGTPLGDPIEVQALGEVLRQGRAADQPVVVGSVKSNLGHTQSAAGVAGVIKALLAMQHGVIPASLHFKEPNPRIPWSELPVRIAASAEPWPSNGKPRIAGVSSFGLSGTNAHLVLQEAPRSLEVEPVHADRGYVLPLSAKSPEALTAMAQIYGRFLAAEEPGNLHDIAYTASVRRMHYDHRLAVVGRSWQDLSEALNAHERGERSAGLVTGEVTAGAQPSVVFVFSGQGSQWVGMGRQLLEQEPVFRASIEACDALVKRYAGWSLLEELAAPEATSRLDQTAIAQPALFAMQVGLCEVLKAWGITPDAVVGHSVGEIAAAHIAGALSLDEAVRLVCCRGQVMQQATGLGKMASVALPAEEASQALRGYEDRLSIAAINDPGSVVLSGDAGALSEVVERLQQQGVHVRMLRVDYAFHSPQMAPFQAELKSALGRIELRRVERPMYSTVTGAKIEGDALEPGYWARNMREPVLLAGALESAIRDGYRLFVEVGPHPVLTANVQECLRASAEPGHALPTLRRGQEERPCLLQALGGLYAHGYAVDWRRQYPERGRVVSLPAYPWQRQRYWIDHKAGMRVAEGAVSSGHPLLGMHVPAAGAGAVFETELSVEAAPYLSDHRVFDEVVVPGAALLELAHAGAAAHLGTERIHVTGLVVQAPLVLPEHERVRVQVVLEEGSAASTPVRVYSQAASAKAGEPWTVHAQGYVQSAADEAEPARVDVADMLARCRTSVSAVERYAAFAEAGVTYGPAFHGMAELWQGAGEAVCRLELPAAAGDLSEAYGMHPALLDAALQTLGAAHVEGTAGTEGVYLPFEVTSYRLWQRGVKEAWVHARRVEGDGAGTEVASGDITVVDSEGRVLAEVKGLRLKRATASALQRGKAATGSEWLLGLSWKEAPLSRVVEERSEPGHWLVLTDGSALGRSLAERLRGQGARCVTAARGAETVQCDEHTWVVDPRSPQGLKRVVSWVDAGQLPLRGVVCLWAAEPFSEGSPAEGAEAIAVAGLHVVQALARRAGGSPAQLWWVTRGAQAVTAGEPVDVAQAPLWGLGRVVMQEHPEMGCTLVDLDAGPGAEDLAGALWQEVWRSDSNGDGARNEETQVAWRRGQRYGARLVRVGAGREPREPLRLEPASTALITGGLGALGLHVARWLVEQHQVRHVVLVSRSAAGGARLAAVEELRSAGAEVTVAQVDIADRAQVHALLAGLPPELPLRAIVHAAGVLDDGVLTHQDAGRFAAVLAPKVHGAWHLHTLTRDLTLDIFVMFSSVASLLGSAGQGNYAAGNAFLDALAQQRLAEGLRAHSIDWGPWSEGGMAAKLDEAQQGRMLRQGVGTLSPAQGLSLLEQVLTRPEAQVGVLPLDLSVLRQTFPAGQVPPLWRALVHPRPGRATNASPGSWSVRLGALSPMERAREVETVVRAEMGRVLSLSSAGEVPEGRPLQELGLDSLMAVELRNGLAGRVGKPLPATLVFDYPTVNALTRYLLDKVLAVGAAPLVVQPSRSRAADNEPIAIVGIGCRYPGGVHDVDSFWSLLEQGVDAIREVPPERWDVNAYYNADPDVSGTMLTRSGGFLDEVEQFDPVFFGISPREAVKMDPQQRLLLETSWEALEHAGLVPERLMDSDTGVFVGMMYHDYASLGDGALDQLDGYVGTGNAGSIASGRISYLLGLKGPSLTVDTACSSSLVTLHLACQSLRSGECSVALAGGVALMLTPASHVEFSRLRGLSPDGRCKSFDASADGVAWSEGCGMVVLKRLSDAQRDGDPVLGLIRGSAVNQDGRSNGLTAPNGPSQEAVIRRALEQAGIAPAAVGYVEAHGTGTPLGDPIEVQALGEVLRQGRAADQPVVVGSVKSNLGHTQSAAGVAGVIKALLAMQHGVIPASLHFKEPNPRIPWSELPVRIAAHAEPWSSNGQPRIAGVSSFGLSGTNAHMVLEEAPRSLEAEPTYAERGHVLPLSAKSPEALTALAQAYGRFLAAEEAGDLHDIVYTASVRRAHYDHRLAVVGRSRQELREGLSSYERGEQLPGMATGQGTVGAQPKVVFVFPGQGSQWVGMARELLEQEPTFRAVIEACERAIEKETGWSLLEELRAEEGRSRLAQIDVVQPVLFAIAVALAALWRSWGIEPDVVVGHSMGEVAAAYVAGALSLEDAARIICRRSRLLRRVSGQGAMALVELPLEQARAAIAGFEDRLAVAVSNSPRSTVLSGEPGALDELMAKLAQEQIFCRRVKVDVASHSPQMDPLLKELLAALAEVEPRAVQVAMYSTVRGQLCEGPELGPRYWAQNLREPVLFGQAVEHLVDSGPTLFVEISPHPILLPALEEGLQEAKHGGAAVGSLRRNHEERSALLESLGALYARGYAVDWKRLYPEGGRVVSLPTYPWQRQRYWVEEGLQTAGAARRFRASKEGKARHSLLGVPVEVSLPGAHVWEVALCTKALPYLSDHRVQGEVVFPGAGYVEMALAAAVEVYGTSVALEQVTFERMLAVPAEDERTVQVVLTEQEGGRASVQISSLQGETWMRHAAATVRLGVSGPEAGSSTETPQQIQERCSATLMGAEHYERMRARDLDYGPSFQGVEQLWVGSGEMLARVCLPQGVRAQAGSYQIHPALLDSCFQALAGLFTAETLEASAAGSDDAYVPVALEHMHVYRRPDPHVWMHGRLRAGAGGGAGVDALLGDVRLLDEAGQLVAEALGLKVQRLSTGSSVERDEEEEWLYALEWQRRELAPQVVSSPPASGAWLVLMDRGETGAALVSQLEERGEACVRAVVGERYERNGSSSVYQVNPAEPQGLRSLLRDAFGQDQPCRGVVHLWSLDATAVGDTSVESLEADQRSGSLSALFLAQALLQQGWRDTPRLWLVTRGAQAVGAEMAEVSVAQAPLWGFGRTLALEHPELQCTRVDLSPSPRADDAAALLRELASRDGEDQTALRSDGRYVARLARSSFKAKEEAHSKPLLEPASGRPFRLEIAKPGVLERLTLCETPRRAPGPGEVEVEVEATGLNFIDVMKAMGIYPGLSGGPVLLGGDCAGKVVAIGEGVQGLTLGQDVIAVAPGAFASHVITPAEFIVAKPAHLSFEEASTIPIAFMTVHYALHHQGRIQRGERILIHSASGGTGLAAVQLAQAMGAEVFATAGSAEKRAYLQSLGVQHVMDSRSLSFADEIMAITKGRGVDLVLNSLTGDALVKSLEVMAPYGRFLEIGKRDIYDNSRLGLLPFRKGLSYTAIDLAGMAVERPALFASLLREVMQLFEAGTFKPLPVHVFPAADVESAFRHMAQAKHIGKIAVSMRDPQVRIAPAVPSDRPRIQKECSYLITGGLGGLGLSVAQWLVGQGARHLALVGRSGASEAARSAIRAMEEAGAHVMVIQADVSREAQAAAMLAELDQRLPPVRGVVHAAGALEDRTVLELDEARFRRAMAPKMLGAWNLHALTQNRSLDFFVLYSSGASLFGSPGQSNYAAGNAFLDALAHQRRAMGLPAMSINWGAFSEVGLAAAQDGRGKRLASRGMESLTPAQGTAVLGRLLEHPRAQIGVVRLNLRQWLEFYPSAVKWPLWAELLKEQRRAEPSSLGASQFQEALRRVEPEERLPMLERHLSEKLGWVLRLDASRLDRQAPFTNLGMDSLMSLELRNQLEGTLGLKLSVALFFTYPTLAALAEHLDRKLRIVPEGAGKISPEGGANDEQLAARLVALQQMSTEEQEILLSERLAALEGLLA